MNAPHEPESGVARNIKAALTLKNISIAVIVAIVLGFIAVCFGVLPL